MQVGDLVRIGVNGVSQFRVLEVGEHSVRIQSTLDVPGSYPFEMRRIDLHPWSQ